MRKGMLAVVAVLVLLGAMPAWANHVDRGTSSMGVLETASGDNLTFGGATFDAFEWSADPGLFIYEIADFSQYASVTLTLQDGSFDFGTFLCGAVLTDSSGMCIDPGAQALSSSPSGPPAPCAVCGLSYTFFFTPTTTTGNSSDPSNWFFYSDTGSNGTDNILGISTTPASVTSAPEPATLALLGTGLLGLAVGLRRLRSERKA
jgi:PEP-CTERM motif